MASWTDAPQIAFNPYVQQVPTEAYVGVGMELQRRYDEGVQKIQSSIDRVAGLDIARDVDKKYLQSKLNELGTKLRTVAAGDFSNYQLTNHVAGMASSVGKDDNITNAVTATAKFRKELSLMEEDRKKGTLDPSNEYVFNNQLSSWMNDEEVGANFDGKYVPHFDIWKFAKETFDAVKPDGMTFDQVYQLGADGKPMRNEDGSFIFSPTMMRMETEGRSPGKVKQTIQQIFSDPRVSQQLHISGQYVYRGTDNEGLKGIITKQRDQIVSGYQTAIDELIIKKNLDKDVENQKDIQKQIDTLETNKKTMADSYDEYISTVDKDPDAVRGLLYRDDVSSRYTTMFGQMITKQQIVDNPGWNAMFKMQQEANDQSRWAQTEEWDRKMDMLNYEQKDRLAILSASSKGKKTSTSGGAGGVGGFTPSGQESDPKKVVTDQAIAYERAVGEYNTNSDNFIWATLFEGQPKYKEKIKQYQGKNNISLENARAKVISDEAAAAGKTVEQYKTELIGIATKQYESLSYEKKLTIPVVVDAYESFRKAKMNFETESDINNKVAEAFKERVGDVAKEIDLSNIKSQQITYKGNTYNLTPQDIYDLSVYKNGKFSEGRSLFNKKLGDVLTSESNAAYRKLQARGLGDVVEALNDEAKGVYVLADKNGKITQAKWRPRQTGNFGMSSYGGEREGIDWTQVWQVAQVFNDKVFEEALEDKSEIIQQYRSVKPNLTAPIFSGNLEDDRNTLYKLGNYMTTFTDAEANLSHDFDKFRKNFSNLDLSTPEKGWSLSTNIVNYEDTPMVEIVLTQNSKRIGGMTTTMDQALAFGIDVNSIYESRESSNIKNIIKTRGGQTSFGAPDDEQTYMMGDYYLSKNDLPNIARENNYDAKINFIYSNGKYYPYVWMSNGQSHDIISLQGDASMQNVLETLQTTLTPSLIDMYLNVKTK